MTTLIEPMPSLLADAAALPDTLFQPRPDELLLGPVSFTPVVQGVSLALPVSVFLSIRPAGDQVQINVRAFAGLADLQHKIGALVDTVPLPRDNCQHFGVNNFVASISGKELTIDGDVATLALQGEVEDWACVQLPFVSPAKTILVTQPFDAALPFRVGLADPHTIAVQLGQPSIKLGGSLAGITQGILSIAGVDLSTKAQELLASSISPDLLRQTLPADLLPLSPVITRAELASHSGDLALYVEMNASIDGKVIGQLIRQFLLGL
jgi:hypothetical protein